jgi:hypothetical protein
MDTTSGRQARLARGQGSVRLVDVVPSLKLLLFGLLSAACGGPPSQTSTTSGITTVGQTVGTSTGSSSGSSTGSESSTSSSGDTAASASSLGNTTVGEPDLPGFETLGPAKGCGKIDILFVINDGGVIDGSSALMESAEDALSIRNGTNAFITAMQEQAAEYDLHVMAVKGDPKWSGYYGWSSCCVPDKPCDQYGPFPCDDPNPDFVNDCDYTLGAGVRYPAGFMASNRDCELGGNRYLTEEHGDFAAAFECILNVGQTGRPGQRYLEAMVKAIGPGHNAPDGCNAGFLRPDAMLVVVILSDYSDDDSPGTPEGLAASLIAAKKGYTDGIVVVGILGTVQSDPPDGHCFGDVLDDRARKFVEGFPTHVLGSFCDPDIGAHLVAAIDVIEAACAEFVPPG